MVFTFAWPRRYIDSMHYGIYLDTETIAQMPWYPVSDISVKDKVWKLSRVEKERYKYLYPRKKVYSGHRMEWFDAWLTRFKYQQIGLSVFVSLSVISSH